MTTSEARPQTLTARSPEDLLAIARVALGFDPDDSVVMLTVGGAHPLHARVDLPERSDELDPVVETIVRPAERHRAGAAVFILYTADEVLARRTASRLCRRLRASPVSLVDVLRADAGRWYPLTRDRRGLGTTGVAYDVSAHPFVVDAVLEGRVLHRSRAELAATLDPVPDEVAAIAAACRDDPRPGEWVEALLAEHTAAGTVPDAEDAARLLESIADPAVRDRAWLRIRRGTARSDVTLWSNLVRRAPDGLVAHAAAVLGFAAWVAGDGALAWCAVDRAVAADPRHSLASVVASMLTRAVPPAEWDRTAAELGSAS